jgi:hypothetical protein
MAVARKSAASAASDLDGANVTVTLPGGLSEGDLVLGYAGGESADGNEAMALTSTGYTLILEQFANDTRDANLATWYKFMGSTPDSTFVVTGFVNATSVLVANAIVYSGVDRTSPLDVGVELNSGLNGTTIDPMSILPITDGSMIVLIAETNVTGAGLAAPSGYGNELDDQDDDGTNVGHIISCDKLQSTAGSETPGSLGDSGGTSNSWVSQTIALRPRLTEIYVVAGVQGSGNGNAATSSLPGGQLDGDLLIAVAAGFDATTDIAITMAASRVGGGNDNLTIQSEGYADDVVDTNAAIGYIFLAGGITYNTVTVDAGTANGVIALLIRGVDTSTPFDVSIQRTDGVDGGTPVAPGITPTTNGALLLSIAAAPDDVSTTTAPSGWYFTRSVRTVFGNGIQIAIAHKPKPTAGAEGTASWGSFTNLTTDDGWITFTIALRPIATSGVYEVSQTETVTVTDANGAEANFQVLITETVTATDVNASNINAQSAVSESVTLTDAHVNHLTLPLSVAESLTLTDVLTNHLTVSVAITETLTPGDGAEEAGGPALLAETVTLADTLSAQLSLQAAVNESITPGDSVAANAIFEAILAETITPAMQQAVSAVLQAAVNEQFTLSDQGAAQASFQCSILFDVELTDGPASSSEGDGDRSVIEQVVLTVTYSNFVLTVDLDGAEGFSAPSTPRSWSASGSRTWQSESRPRGWRKQ